MNERILMCAPDHYQVTYVINPWMKGNVDAADRLLAMRQWRGLSRALGRVARIVTVPAGDHVPDMVFTANAGLVLGGQAILSRFRHPQRQQEEALFAHWFAQHGFVVRTVPEDVSFEGAGDALLDRGQPLLWLGHGHRTDPACAPLLAQWLGVDVEPLKLVDARFYHLDTCFCPLEGGVLMFHPPAFDPASVARIVERVPAEKRIAVSQDDALAFACNAVNIGRHVFLNDASAVLAARLRDLGFVVHRTPLTEFMKAGGAAKCLTLKLDERAGGSVLRAA